MSAQPGTALITGGASGIGYVAARAFLDKGYSVVINGRNAEKLEAAAERLEAPERVAIAPGDIGDPETGAAMVRVALERFGSVDVLVNNAGTFGAKPFVDVTEDDLDSYINGNLKGTYFTTQAAVRQMLKQGGGSVVNIGTTLIDHASTSVPATAPLVTKGGVHALTVNLAAELAPQNIRVNAVAPGIVRTPLFDGADVDDFAGMAMMNRVGEPDELGEAIGYMAEAEFVTGHILPVDGGYVSGRS